MKSLRERITEIKEYYRTVDALIAEQMGTQTFATGEIEDRAVYQANALETFEHIVLREILLEDRLKIQELEKKNILDAGSGDGRSLAAFSAYGLNAYGVDLDGGLIAISNRASHDLTERGSISKEFRSVAGSYLDTESYERLGTSFSDMDYIVHSMNTPHYERLIEKFAEESKSGAKLVLLGGFGLPVLVDDIEKHGLKTAGFYKIPGPSNQGHFLTITKN